jgi:4-diphosphocytidyl-2-C-methyl-D-erythritol kinase
MNQTKQRAYAKINLGLDVLRRRPDGYHEVKMVMQTVDIYDDLFLEKTEKPGVELQIEGSELTAGKDNLICRAAELFMEEKEIAGGVKIRLVKRIPIAAGMAGGSSDAAATLRGMNELWETGCSAQELQKLGVRLGADIPYCVVGGTMLSEGIGEILTPLPAPPECVLLIAKPEISVSTKFVYENLHADTLKSHPDIDGMVEAIRRGKLEGITERMGNVLETVTTKTYPVIEEIKTVMKEKGAENALMSGSGPTVFGIFGQKEQAEAAAAILRERDLAKQVFVTAFQEDIDGK